MSTMSLRLPESLHKQLRDLAKREKISLNQLISTAVAEKIASLLTEDYLAERGRRASREKFDRVLSKVHNRAPQEDDTL